MGAKRERVYSGRVVTVNESQEECELHGGEWKSQDGDGFCVIRDEQDYLAYLNHTDVGQTNEIGALHTDVRFNKAVPSLAYTGLSPNSPVESNENGGMQSVVEGRFDLIPPIAAFELAQVMQHGAEKYAPGNWKKIPVDSHLNHLLMHVFAYLAGDRQEKHLTHALARAAMAVEIEQLGVQK